MFIVTDRNCGGLGWNCRGFGSFVSSAWNQDVNWLNTQMILLQNEMHYGNDI